MSWLAMSRDSLRAARLAHLHGHSRSAVSGAYFAAYSALTGVLTDSGYDRFRYQGNNPGHRQLLSMVANNLDRKSYAAHVRKNIKRSLSILQALRINADYNPDESSTTTEDALIGLRNATAVLLGLEVLGS